MYGKAKQSQKTPKRVRGKVYSAHTTSTLVIRDPEGSERGREGKY